MAKSLGKQFEERFEKDWTRLFPTKTIMRLPDQQSRHKGSSNPCDYVCFNFGKAFFVECKETKLGTFNFHKLTQYDKLLDYDIYDDTYPGVLIWFSSFDKIVWANIKDIKQMMDDGLKSINIKHLADNKYNLIEVPSVKLRKFMMADLTFFSKLRK